MEIDKQPTLDELEALVKLAEIEKEKRIQNGEKEYGVIIDGKMYRGMAYSLNQFIIEVLVARG